jgi:general L-amino acid transport system substrate-binding protein
MAKRIILLVVVLAMIATACASGTAETTTTATTAAPTQTTAPSTQGSLLQTVLDRGVLKCGVNETLPGFGSKDSSGQYVGFDVDLCKAVAAAVLGDASQVEYTSLTAAQRFEALNSGAIDVLSRNTTWTQDRDTELGLTFAPTTYYDGQQIMARAADGFTADSTLDDLAGATVCTNQGTTTEKNISEAMKSLGLDFTLKTFEDFNLVLENFKSGACDAVTTDGSGLVSEKSVQEPAPGDWVIFPTVPISKEPLGPATKQNDDVWSDAIAWTVFAMITAEENGITSANVDDMKANPPNGEVQRMLGGEGELQTVMGLPADAFYQTIKQVGNYGEVFDRNLTVLGLQRGLNALWTNGGLMYAPPFH